MNSTQTKDILLCVLITAIWGSNFTVIKIGLNEMDPFVLTTLRFFLCAFPFVFFIKKPDNYLIVILYGIIFGVGLWGMVNLGIHTGINPGMSSILLQFSAFFSVFGGVIFFKEKLSLTQLIGFCISLIGLIFILFNSQGRLEILGGSLVLFAAFSWSVCNILIKKYKVTNILSFIIHSSLYASISLFLLTIFLNGYDVFNLFIDNLNYNSVFSITFQAYITTLFGYWVWNKLILKYDLSKIAPFSLLVPIFGVLTAIVVLGEKVDNMRIVGITILFFGLMIFVFNNKFKIYSALLKAKVF
jgi:O-acetylserine/cysteine efflux transporter